MSERQEGIIRRLQKVEGKYFVYWTLVIVLTLPYVFPLKLPVPIPASTLRAMEYVNALKPGDYVIFHISTPGTWAEYGPTAYAMFNYLLKKDARVVLWTSSSDATNAIQMVVNNVKPESFGKRYGVDYVNFGYIPGVETAYASLAKDIQNTMKVDFFGTPIDKLPIMNGILNAGNFAMWVQQEAGDGYMYVARHWVSSYHTKQIVLCTAIVEADLATFLASGQVAGYISSIGGAAALELITNRPGSALLGMDTLSASHVLWILFVAAGNIAYFTGRLTQKRKEGG